MFRTSSSPRGCPKCRVELQVVSTTFAEIDACPKCGGVFLDPGEGVAAHGADSDGSFLVDDGRAKRVGVSTFVCPVTEHPAALMDVYAMRVGARTVEFEHCPTCKGFFLDRGEGAALAGLEAMEPGQVMSETGARFSAPPVEVDREALVIDRARAAGARGYFQVFVRDVLVISAAETFVGDEEAALERRRRFFDGD